MGSLTVHVLRNNEEPVTGKRVFVKFIKSFAGIGDTTSEDYTDSDGIVEFDDIPTGEVEVIVDGVSQVNVSVGQNDHEDVTVSL